MPRYYEFVGEVQGEKEEHEERRKKMKKWTSSV